jgi:hypothetical protein
MRLAILGATLLFCNAARADEPKYEYKDVTAAPTVDEKKPTVWKASATLGLVWVAGNAQSLGFSGSFVGGVKHYNNEWTLNAAGAYVSSGTSKFGPGGPITDTVTSANNWLVKGRYDRYFFEKNTVFVSFQSSGDQPAGYIYRLEPQVGYARLFFKSVHQVFRGEIGYDYTFQHNVPPPPPADPTQPTPPQDVQYQSGRLFLYYENKFSAYASFSEGLELLEAFNKLEGFRLNSITSLSSVIYKNISLKLNFKLNFNNDPPLRPAPTMIDPLTMMPFVYTADQTNFGKVDTQLDLVLAITFL